MGVYGPDVQTIFEAGGDEAIAIAEEVTVYSQSFDLKFGGSFTFLLKSAAGTTRNLLVELEQSDVKPATEGAEDANWVVPTGAADVVSAIIAATRIIQSFSPATTRYGRLKITGLTGNTSDVTLNAKLSMVTER